MFTNMAQQGDHITHTTNRHGPHDLLEVRGVSKAFPGVVALDNVQFRLGAGTVHALLGENGAGKSTLMKIIAGIYRPDQGEICLRGEVVTLKDPRDAISRGIAMIHQELHLLPSLTVAENIWIGREPRHRFGLVDHAQLRRQTRTLFERLAIDVDPESEVRSLTVANRQLVEIAKAVSFDSDVIIMDEPTSALPDREVGNLFRIIRQLCERGAGIIYITHRMSELFEIADACSVLRDGRYISTHATSEITRDAVIRMMVGREIADVYPKVKVQVGPIVLSVKEFALDDVFQGVSFDLRSGEVLGIAGLVGSGRTSVAKALFGIAPATAGEVRIDGDLVAIRSPSQAMNKGMAFLTEDRQATGCFLKLDLLANMEIAVLKRSYVKAHFVERERLTADCDLMCRRLHINAPGLDTVIEQLSGGNQQKALLGRWLLTRPRILILDEPTRGIDVGAKAEVHRIVNGLLEQGLAVILISSDLPELLGMSDRIVVMREGQMAGIVERRDADQVRIMELACH